jgi:hypothetical protein
MFIYGRHNGYGFEEEEEETRDEHDGLRLWSSGAISHPVEEINLRETRAAATTATVGSC